MTLPALLVRPEERQCLQAVQARLEQYSSENRFQNWLDRQDDENLQEVLKGEPKSAQRFLYQHNPDVSGSIPAHLISLALAMIEQWGWDVNMEGEFWHSRRTRTYDNETFLEWLTAHRGESTCLPKLLKWPTTPEAFVQFDQEHRLPRNQEWFIALVVASGANPWTMARPKRRHLALQNCYFHGHPAIAVQLLSLPGAPTWREALDTPCCEENYTLSSTIFIKTIANEAADYYQSNFLPTLLAFPQLPLSPEELVSAKKKTMAFNLKHCPPATQTVDEIEKQLDTMDGHYFGPLQNIQRLAMLPKNHHWTREEIKQMHAEKLARKILCSPWKEYRKIEFGEQEAIGSQWLTRRTKSEGPFSGTWSLLNAYLLEKLKTAVAINGLFGTHELQLKHWVLKPHKRYVSDTRKITQCYPELANLIWEDLENGLPVHGLWVLVFLSKSFGKETEKTEPELEENTKGVNTNGLDNERIALGIHDWKAFFETGRQAAVEATEWIIRRTNEPDQARKSLAIVWAQCLRRFPTWMDHHPELLLRAIRVLSPGQCLYWSDLDVWPNNSDDAWGQLMLHVMQRQKHPGHPQELLSSNDFLHVEALLGIHHPEHLNSISALLETQPPLSKDTLIRLQAWADTQGGITKEQEGHRHYSLGRVHLNRFKSAVLQNNLPGATVAATDKPRF